MRFLLSSGITMLVTLSLFAEKKVVSPTTSASNDQIDVVATISLTEDEIAHKIGADPGKGVALLDVRVTPKTDKAVQLSPDDFILLAYDDGERSKPFDPAELAGQAVIAVAASDEQSGADSLSDRRTRVLVEFADALRQSRPAILPSYSARQRLVSQVSNERRSGLDRRVGSDRRHLPPGNASQAISLRLFGERRVGVVDRRSGVDRRMDADDPKVGEGHVRP